MRKLWLAALSLLCVCFMAGCVWGAASNNGAVKPAAQITGIPQEAELVYSYTANGVSGIGVATDTWSLADDTGFFVLEVLCGSGSIRQLELRQAEGEAVAAFGRIRESGIWITDIVTEAAGDYSLYFARAKEFAGEIHVYFVPGIGYSIPDEL